jgi:Terminase RNaseH-like domain
MDEKICVECKKEFTAERSKESLCPSCRNAVVIGGLDFGRLHDYSAIVGLKIRDNVAEVLGLKIWPHVDYNIVVRDTAEIYHRMRMRQLAIDSTDAMVEPIAKMLATSSVSTTGIKFGESINWKSPWGAEERVSTKQAMVEFARACMQQKKVKLPKRDISETSDELLTQLREQEIANGADAGQMRYTHPSNSHDDLAWAFLMALYASRRWLSDRGGSVAIVRF